MNPEMWAGQVHGRQCLPTQNTPCGLNSTSLAKRKCLGGRGKCMCKLVNEYFNARRSRIF